MFGNHPIGIYEKAFEPHISWQQRFERAAGLGFDYIEISIDETDARLSRLNWSKKQKKELLDASWNSGISIRSMCLSAHRRFPFGSKNAEIRKNAFTIMEKAIDFAADLGIRIIQLAGYDVYYEDSTEESVHRFEEGIKWAADKAASKQVMLAMEIMDTPFMNSISKHLIYERKINSPWYRVYPDLGNLSAWSENNSEEEINKGIGSIVAIHLKDTIPPTEHSPGQFKSVPFGAGCVDFTARFGQLEKLNYQGPYMIEMWYKDGTDDVSEISRALNWLSSQYERRIL
ncbi:MAG: L-ribulose-5-phosphate 3-epimerase [Clostridia bacterium]|nr:L-ribulose-5-phosphate 3-epimerase [Clostridia bacterium]